MEGLLIGTRKGAFLLERDGDGWRLKGPWFLGNTVHHAVLDPRDGRTLLVAARTGHLGPTVFRSTDRGETWAEATTPAAFAKVPDGARKRAVHHLFWLTPGHPSEPGVWYGGSSPQGLFRSDDGGASWSEVKGLNDHPDLTTWTGGEQDGTPDGPKLHSVIVDPRDPSHLFVGMSGGGIFRSLDRGATWAPLNKGVAIDFLPPGEYEFGHDPHCIVQHPTRPDRLYHQNHCGLYRLDLPDETWVRIGRNLPDETGDIGFPVVVHPRDPDTAWVFPMDGTSVWPRTPPGARPACFRTRDAGETWERLDRGLPDRAWFTVKRQCMTHDGGDPLAVFFGSSSGAIWGGFDEGDRWERLVEHLPHVYAVEYARFA